MTVVCAVRKKVGEETVTYMAADSLMVMGLTKMRMSNPEKIIPFTNFTVGFSGICTMQTVLYELQRKKGWRTMRMSGVADVVKFSRQCFKELSSRLVESGENVAEAIGELLIVTPKQIFICDKFGFVAEYSDFASIGCANDLVTGVVVPNWKNVKTKKHLKNLAIQAVRVCCENNTGCGGPVRYIEVE